MSEQAKRGLSIVPPGAPDMPDAESKRPKPQDAHTRIALHTREAEAFPFDKAMPIAGAAAELEALRYKPVPYPGNCPATTKAGTRCGRTVVLGNGRCRSNGHGGENRPEDIAAMRATIKARADRKARRAARRARKAARGGNV